MEIDYGAIGRRIRQKRTEKKLTQEALADMVGVTSPHLSNIETGKTKLSLPTLVAAANALSVSPDVLLCDNVMPSRVIFEGEAKQILDDCDEYEVRMLVDILKSMKEVIRRNRQVRDQPGD